MEEDEKRHMDKKSKYSQETIKNGCYFWVGIFWGVTLNNVLWSFGLDPRIRSKINFFVDLKPKNAQFYFIKDETLKLDFSWLPHWISPSACTL